MLTTDEAVEEALARLVAGRDAARVPGEGRRVSVGLVGRAIQSSRSPIMHEREGARLGLFATYALLDFDRLGLADAALAAVVDAAARLGFAGLNVTHPFKQTVIRHLDRLSPEADAIGAVNTVVFGPGGRVGHNTDGWGFAESFRDGLPGAGLGAVLQFGAGGAGAAVGHALLDLGAATLQIVDTDAARAEALARRLSAGFGRPVTVVADIAAAAAVSDGIVNTTPVGMAKYPGLPLPRAALAPRHWVADVVYFPEDTELLRTARAVGCRTLAGTGMAVYQAVRAFELFTGLAPDRAAMRGHFAAGP